MESSESRQTVRQQILDLLSLEEMTVRDLSQAIRISEKEVISHLGHVERTVQGHDRQLVVTPFKCLSCGFEFAERSRLSKPGRCPKCRKTHIQAAKYRIR